MTAIGKAPSSPVIDWDIFGEIPAWVDPILNEIGGVDSVSNIKSNTLAVEEVSQVLVQDPSNGEPLKRRRLDIIEKDSSDRWSQKRISVLLEFGSEGVEEDKRRNWKEIAHKVNKELGTSFSAKDCRIKFHQSKSLPPVSVRPNLVALGSVKAKPTEEDKHKNLSIEKIKERLLNERYFYANGFIKYTDLAENLGVSIVTLRDYMIKNSQAFPMEKI